MTCTRALKLCARRLSRVSGLLSRNADSQWAVVMLMTLFVSTLILAVIGHNLLVYQLKQEGLVLKQEKAVLMRHVRAFGSLLGESGCSDDMCSNVRLNPKGCVLDGFNTDGYDMCGFDSSCYDRSGRDALGIYCGPGSFFQRSIMCGGLGPSPGGCGAYDHGSTGQDDARGFDWEGCMAEGGDHANAKAKAETKKTSRQKKGKAA